MEMEVNIWVRVDRVYIVLTDIYYIYMVYMVYVYYRPNPLREVTIRLETETEALR